MAAITETYILTADQNDVLDAPSRLAAIPYNGELTVEVSATKCTSAINMKLTVQTPDGETPVDGQIITANGYDADNAVLNNQSETMFVFPATQGGHFLLSVDLTGTLVGVLRATLSGG